MRILILSAYEAQSHRHWHQGLVQNCPDWDFTVLTLPARYFAWRIRGNSLSWAFGDARQQLTQPYDLIIATSMVDLSALKGFVPELANTPCWVYFHENQFAYPTTEHRHQSVEPQMVTLYSALAADAISFNSHFNRDTFLAGVKALLKKLPDHVPAGIVERLEAKSDVLSVPLNNLNAKINSTNPGWQETSDGNTPIRLVWAARWEYDKGPDRLLAITQELKRRQVSFRLAVLGESFRNTPKEFGQIQQECGDVLDQFGYAESKAEYYAWLHHADLVLSTATHEFQGVSVLEAVSLGCKPVLPNRLVYPELFGSSACYPTQEFDGVSFDQEIAGACDLIAQRGKDKQTSSQASTQDGDMTKINGDEAVKRFYWSELNRQYQMRMRQIADIRSKV
jgi:glycosyltransferase involved in cell wall biosynthesis